MLGQGEVELLRFSRLPTPSPRAVSRANPNHFVCSAKRRQQHHVQSSPLSLFLRLTFPQHAHELARRCTHPPALTIMPRGWYLAQGLTPLGEDSSDDYEGPCKLPDGRLVCGPPGLVWCGKCYVDCSFTTTKRNRSTATVLLPEFPLSQPPSWTKPIPGML